MATEMDRISAVVTAKTEPAQNSYKQLARAVNKCAREIDRVSEALHVNSDAQRDDSEASKKGTKDTENAAKAKKKLTAEARKASAQMRKFGENIGNSITKKIDGALPPLKKLINRISGLKMAIGRVAFYRAIRTAVKEVTDGFREGIDNLYHWSRAGNHEFSDAMDKMSTSALYLKNSLGALAAPLVEKLAPAMDFIVDKFVDILNAANETIARFLGKSTWTKAIKVPHEYAEEASEAAQRQKEWNQQLMGFDELNVLTSPKSPTGGGSSDSEDYSSMFETEEVSIDVASWVDSIVESINNGEWAQAGELLAEKVNSILSKFNGREWGEKLGRKINNGLAFVESTIRNIHWDVIGQTLSGYINGLVETVDWNLFGHTLASWFNAKVELAFGLLSTLDWGGIGTAIGDYLIGLWSNIDTAKLAELISTIGRGLLDAIIAAVSTLWQHRGEVWERIKDFFANLTPEGGVLLALTVTASIAKVMGITPSSILGSIASSLAGASVSGNALHIAIALGIVAATVAIIANWDGIKACVSEFVDTVSDVVKDVVNGEPIDWTDTVLGGADSFAERILGISSVEEEAERLGTTVENILEKARLTDLIDELSWQDNMPDWLQDFTNMFLPDYAKIDTAREKLEKLNEEIQADAREMLGAKTNTGLFNKALEKTGYWSLQSTEGIKSFTSNVKKSTTAVNNNAGGATGLNHMYRNLMSRYSAMNPNIKIFNSRMKDSATRIGNVSSRVSTSNERLGNMSSRLKTLNSRVSTANSRLSTAKNRFANVNSSVKTTNSRLSTSSSRFKNLSSNANSANGNLSKMKTRFADVNTKASTFNSTANSVKTSLSGIEIPISKKEAIKATFGELVTASNPLTTLAGTIVNSLSSVPDSLNNETVKGKWKTVGKEFGRNYKEGFAEMANAAITNTPAGQTHPDLISTIAVMARGGFPDMGSLFVAGEVPGQTELVGSINGRTGVASGSEITGIADAVYATGSMEEALLRTLIKAVESKNLTISPSANLGRVINKSAQLYKGVTG